MKKLLLFVVLFGPIFAEDKPVIPPQPTAEERLSIMQAQRDWMLAERHAHDLADVLDKSAETLGAKYHCVKWNPDFTCIVELPKVEKKK